MYNLSEMLDKTVEQRKTLEKFMDEKGYFDPAECNIYAGLKRSVHRELWETLRKVPLTEFLGKSNTTGIAGAAYLIPDVVSAKIYSSLQARDIVPLISADIIQNPQSDTVTVNTGLMSAQIGKQGRTTSTADITKATITLQKISANIQITNEIIEDNNYPLIEWHLTEAAKALASRANSEAITVLSTATDGRGTTVALAAGSDTTTPTHVGAAIALVGSGGQSATWPGFVADTMVAHPEAWGDALAITAGTTAAPPKTAGYDAWFAGLNVVIAADPKLTGGFTSNRAINCLTLVFSKDYAMVTARKGWGRIENYSKPIEDLEGAVLSGRQDSVTVNDDAIVKLLES